MNRYDAIWVRRYRKDSKLAPTHGDFGNQLGKNSALGNENNGRHNHIGSPEIIYASFVGHSLRKRPGKQTATVLFSSAFQLFLHTKNKKRRLLSLFEFLWIFQNRSHILRTGILLAGEQIDDHSCIGRIKLISFLRSFQSAIQPIPRSLFKWFSILFG